MPILDTARLIVRPFVADDLDVCHRLYDLEAWQTGRSLDERREWLEWSIRNHEALAGLEQPPYGDRAVVLKESNALIGAVGLVPALGPFDRLPSFGADVQTRHFRPEVGLFWALRTAHRGHGYATEAARAVIRYAFDELALARIVATTEHTNAGSRAVMHRLGMRVECNPLREPEWFQVVGVLAAPGIHDR